MDQGTEKLANLISRFPWRIITALLLTLLAQSLLEVPPLNPVRHPVLGASIYLIAILMVLWAWRVGEIKLASLPTTIFRPEGMDAHWGLTTIALIILLISFFLFKGGVFDLLNLSVWLLGLGLLVWAFWDHSPGSHSRREGVQERVKLLLAGIKFSRWTVILMLAVGLVIFFRVYRLNSLPPEPFSDHAEKLLDVYDVLQGKTRIFFPRNTGREAIQFYLTALVIIIFKTGVSFLSLKIGTAAAGLATLVFIYLLGREIGGQRTGLFALVFAGISYWGNVISRIGLRYVLYALFTAATLYFLTRGLRRSSRNDIILTGLLLGLGLHGYTSFRIMPFIVLIAFVLYWSHPQSRGMRTQSTFWFGLMIIMAIIVSLPLLRYTLENPEVVLYRSMTRLTGAERAINDSVWRILFLNAGHALVMPFWSNGTVWVHSLLNRPALDVVSAALLLPGVTLLLARYIKQRDWRDIFLVLAIPILMLPSILSIAFPAENPSLNRTSAAILPIMIVIALCLDGFMSAIEHAWRDQKGMTAAWFMAILLIALSSWQNYDLVFRQYDQQYRYFSWNSTEMGELVREFLDSGATIQQVFVLEYPHWVDSRLISIAAGHPETNPIIYRDELLNTLKTRRPLLFLMHQDDLETLEILKLLYPQGTLSRYTSDMQRHNFLYYVAPAVSNNP